ncbi:MAG: FAD-dependent monooxygenase, partial [Dehalococcoidia bacterium]
CGDVSAKMVVGADGLHSRIRRLAGLEARDHGNRYGISVHVVTGHPVEPWVDVHFSRHHELYFTPVGPHEMNVALLTRKPAMAQFAGQLATSFEAFLRKHPAMPSEWSITSPAAAAGPFPSKATRAFRANVVLVGDAAGFFDGITGEGMSLALRSARLCAEALERHLETGSPEPFRAYDRERRALSRNSEIMGKLMLALGPRAALARWSTRNLARQPTTFERLAAINAGERPLSSLRPRDLLALALGF